MHESKLVMVLWTIAVVVSVSMAVNMVAKMIFRRSNKMPVRNKTVLVTGGSQGMGKSLAVLLAQKGANVVIVARNVEKLRGAIEEIAAHAGPSQRFHFISADITSSSEASRILQESTTWNDARPPDIVINCAGSSHPGHFLDLDPTVMRDQMDANYMSSMYVAHAACRLWLRYPENKSDPERHLIFTSSLIAFFPLVGYNAYCPAKTALRALSDGLRQELLLYQDISRIKPHCIFPGTIYTPGYDAETVLKPAVLKKLEETETGQSPETVAKLALEALERGHENITTSGLLGRAMQAGMLGSSKRTGFGIVDLLLSWLVGVIVIITRIDMDRTVCRWGRERPQDRRWPAQSSSKHDS